MYYQVSIAGRSGYGLYITGIRAGMNLEAMGMGGDGFGSDEDGQGSGSTSVPVQFSILHC